MENDKAIHKSPTLNEAILWLLILAALAYVLSRRIIPELSNYCEELQLAMAFLALLIFELRGNSLKNLGFRFSFKVAKQTLVFTAILGAFYAILGFFALYVLKIPQADMSGINYDFRLVAAMIIVAPIAEEIFFRGFLYTALRKEMNCILSILISAALFMAMHQVWGIVGIENLNHFFGGIVFAFAYEKTKSIYAPMILHFLGNGSLIVISQIL